MRRIGWGGYRSPGAVTPATAAEPEALTVGVFLALAPAMMYPASLAEESQHADLLSPVAEVKGRACGINCHRQIR
jgi:hypothetical protein